MSRVNPDGVVQSTPQVQLLARIIDRVYADLIDVTDGVSLSSASRRIAIARELDKMVAEGREDMFAWVDITVPEFYLRGVERTVTRAVEAGAIVRFDDKFVRINQKAINALIQNGHAQLDNVIASADKMTQTIINEATRNAILEEVAKKRITGESENKLVAKLAKTLKTAGVDKVTTRSGRNYSPRAYGQMLSRTLLTQAQVDGTTNQMAMDGHDLGIVSDHFGESDLCRPWENEILSINGMYPQYARLDTAKAAGLYRPNCRHVFDPYYEGFAKESKVWDAKTQTYVPLSQAEPQNYQRLSGMSAKDKLKAFDEYTTKIGLGDYHGINNALQTGNKQSLDYYASKQEDPKMYEKIHRLRKYL
jgi:hypothetical protein